jgi:hypothetical protein
LKPVWPVTIAVFPLNTDSNPRSDVIRMHYCPDVEDLIFGKYLIENE